MTVTRSVMLFSELETRLDGALREHDEATLKKLVAANFEQRNGANPGKPTPRADWIAASKAHAVYELGEMAVHEYDGISVVSFLSTGAAQRTFIVDVWSKSGDSYVLSVRYTSPAGAGTPQTQPANPAK
jgi:hypothetical protein